MYKRFTLIDMKLYWKQNELKKQIIHYVGWKWKKRMSPSKQEKRQLEEGSIAVTPGGHSHWSIFTFGSLRKVQFFFSFISFVFAWKFCQLSTWPSWLSSKFFCHSISHLSYLSFKFIGIKSFQSLFHLFLLWYLFSFF